METGILFDTTLFIYKECTESCFSECRRNQEQKEQFPSLQPQASLVNSPKSSLAFPGVTPCSQATLWLSCLSLSDPTFCVFSLTHMPGHNIQWPHTHRPQGASYWTDSIRSCFRCVPLTIPFTYLKQRVCSHISLTKVLTQPITWFHSAQNSKDFCSKDL